jgi:hypothetical protein
MTIATLADARALMSHLPAGAVRAGPATAASAVNERDQAYSGLQVDP